MGGRDLLSVAGYDSALKVLSKDKEREIITMLEDEARKFLATSFKEPLELTIPIKISKRMIHSSSVFNFKTNSIQKRIKGLNCFINQREAIDIRISHVLVIGSILDNDFSYLLNTLRENLVKYALFIMGETFMEGYPIFESTLTRLGIRSSLSPFSKFTSYDIMDTYTCRNKHELCATFPHSLKARTYYCPVCKECLDRTNIDFYKYPPVSLDSFYTNYD